MGKKKVAQYKVVADVVHRCLDKEFIAEIETFMASKSGVFEGAAPLGEEQKLEYTIVHHEWSELFEQQIKTTVEANGSTISEFFELCKKSRGVQEASGLEAFTEVLLSVTEYPIFHDLVTDKAKREYLYQIMSGWQRQAKTWLENNNFETEDIE